MKEYLKGNYELDAVIEDTEEGEAAPAVEEFEKKALARLGGSICFVSKKAFIWKGDEAGDGGRA